MGAKIRQNPKKSLDQNFTPQKSHAEFPSQNNLFTELRGRDTWELFTVPPHNLQIVLNTQKNAYLNQATQKNTCQNLPTQKYREIENLKPKKIFDYPCHFKSGVFPPPPGQTAL